MTDSTTTAAESPSVAVTPQETEPTKPARRWSTLTLAITAVVALVLGLGIGGASGWAIANAQRPQFAFQGGPGGDGQFQPPGDGQFPGNGDAPQRGDGTTDGTDGGGTTEG